MTTDKSSLARNLTFHAAILIVIGSLTGIYLSAAMTKKIDVEVSAAMAAHLNAYMGAFWMLGVAWSLQFSRLSIKAMTTMAIVISAANYANWIITFTKSILKVTGLDFVDSAANKAVHGSLILFVVIPTLIGSIMWAWGLRPGTTEAPNTAS
jgi:(hydroxyamino)benzene mutase